MEWMDYTVSTADPGVEALRAHYVRHVYERHSHETYSLGVTESGVQSFTCDGVAHHSTAGRVMLFNPGQAHDGHAGAPDGYRYRMIYLPEDMVMRAVEDAREGAASAAPRSGFPLVEDGEFAQAILALHELLAADASRLEREAGFDRAILLLARRHADRRMPDPPPRAHPGSAPLDRVRDLLHAAPPEQDLSIDHLAQVAGLTRYHLCRAFGRAYGLPPHAYRMQIRLGAAKRLLLAGDPLAEVAAATGFADQSHFHRRFKGAFGLTPGQFVRSVRPDGARPRQDMAASISRKPVRQVKPSRSAAREGS